ncbi:MAG: bifunctional phosphoribosylaminoimidazolecarboxamide formyltransferase/IMP cyclohydrolase [Corynebacterium sp.]|nr:bifunctional phosphoribosylaminoimidazolecarboxamide formyltransferase/IMP cyclohydrolase [Corynebacterium sp.]
MSETTQRIPVRRAIISVFDKTGVVELAEGLAAAGVEIVSTGSTAATIRDAGVEVQEVSDLTGFPETLDGRVKTLHPRVHAGILADTTNPEHVAQLDELGIAPFQLVVVNLYPFQETVAAGGTREEIIEKIDIGGPSMVRGAAKNHNAVAVVVNPAEYGDVLAAVQAGGFTQEQRVAFATEAFHHTAIYDAAIAHWMSDGRYLSLNYTRSHDLRYGENPHQQAALYVSEGANSLAEAQQLGGKEMSYNNYTDATAAWRSAYDYADPCVAIIKHANPCGIATADTIAAAHAKAHACDPVSAYGGIIATNREVTAEMAAQVKPIFTEAIVAPSYEEEALAILQEKKNLRILVCDAPNRSLNHELKPIPGGLLVQDMDQFQADGDNPTNWQLVSGEPADAATLRDLEFVWRAGRSVKSNAIVLAHDTATVGVGMGQVNRVDSARLAVSRAGERARGSVAASDAFFPFADGLEVLIEAGVRAVVQPGGSIRDEESIAAAQKAGITMYLTGARHFFH